MKPLCLLLVLLPMLRAHAAETYNLVRVMVTGSQRYGQEDLVRATGLTANSRVTLDDLQAAATRLQNSGAFSTIQFSFKPVVRGVEADFVVKDAGKFLPVEFENFVWFSDSDLEQALHQALPLYTGTLPLSGAMPDDVSENLKKLLAAKGLPGEVSYMMFAELGKPVSAYRYKVENAGLKIEAFHLSGAARVAPDVLNKSLAAARGQEYFRSNTQKILELSLGPVYGERGFLNFRIVGFKPVLNANGSIAVEVSVNEGERYRLAGFSWSGNTLLSSEELSKSITLKVGEPVNVERLGQDLSKARKLFGKYGREAAYITPVPTLAADTVTYNFTVHEGDVYHMGGLEIEGFDAETTRKLTESWKLATGAPYDTTYIQQFLIRTLPLAHGRQHEWAIIEQPDIAAKIVNVRLKLRAD